MNAENAEELGPYRAKIAPGIRLPEPPEELNCWRVEIRLAPLKTEAKLAYMARIMTATTALQQAIIAIACNPATTMQEVYDQIIAADKLARAESEAQQ